MTDYEYQTAEITLRFEVRRNRPSVTQGSASVYINGEKVITFGDEIEIIKAPTYLVITGFQSGQGYRHTHMAEAFCRSMNADGFETQMYYQMD